MLQAATAEPSASAAVSALRRRLEVTARALRDGVWNVVAAREIVASDVIRLRGGSHRARANEEARNGVRVLALARSEDDGPLRLVGLALLRDPPRPDSRKLISELRSLGIGVKMLTGDGLPVARAVARWRGSSGSARRNRARERPARSGFGRKEAAA